MWAILLLFTMIFFHIVDDYYLQGILASMKQKKWWKENASDPMYKYDYVAALMAHAFSWSFMVHLPGIFYTIIFLQKTPGEWLLLSIPFHMMIHAIIDNGKANEHSINLIQDQAVHLFQVLAIWLFYAVIAA